MRQSNNDGGLPAPKGDSALVQGFPASDDHAVQSAQGMYAPVQSVNRQAHGVDPTNLHAAPGPVQSGNRQAPSGGPTSRHVAAGSAPHQAASSLLPQQAGVALSQPQSYVGGHLENYMANFEHGDSQRQTEEMKPMLPPPHVPGPPADEYKGGDLQLFSSFLEHGDHASETERRGEVPRRPYYGAVQGARSVGMVAPEHVAVVPAGPQRVFYPPGPIGLDPYMYYLFITGQLPHGTYTHASATHDAGGNHYGEAHYQKFGPQPRQTQVVSSDVGMQQAFGGGKGH